MNNIASLPSRHPSIEELLQSVVEPSPQVRGKSVSKASNPYVPLRDNRVGFSGQAVELSVSPSARSSQLYKFYTELEEKLDQMGNHGFISRVHHSQSRGATFTVKFRSLKNGEFVEALSQMSEIAEVTESPEGDSAYPNIAHKFNVCLAQ